MSDNSSTPDALRRTLSGFACIQANLFRRLAEHTTLTASRSTMRPDAPPYEEDSVSHVRLNEVPTIPSTDIQRFFLASHAHAQPSDNFDVWTSPRIAVQAHRDDPVHLVLQRTPDAIPYVFPQLLTLQIVGTENCISVSPLSLQHILESWG